MRVSATTFQNAVGKYLKLVSEGKDMIITKNERGIAKLVAYQDPMPLMIREAGADYSVRKRITYEEYLQLTEHSDARYELIDGQILLMASPSHQHQVAIREIFGQMYNFFNGKSCSPLMAPFDVRLHNDSPTFLDDPNVVQPDILVMCDEDQVDEKGRYHGIPSLIVEVLSPSNRRWDMVKKLTLYIESGIKEYWIVDQANGVIMQYTMEGEEPNWRQVPFGSPVHSVYFQGLVVETVKIPTIQ